MAQRVLIVEDEHHLAEGLRFNLEAEGYSADIEESGDKALGRLLDPAQHYDLVVLDVMLPGKDGFAVARALRQHKNFVPVLMLTARGRPEDVLKPSPRNWRFSSRASAACFGAAPGREEIRNRATIASPSTAARSISTGSSSPWAIAS